MLEVLTQSEIELAGKLVGRLEKSSRLWVWKRWVMLIGGIVSVSVALGCVVYLYGSARKFYSAESYLPDVLTDERPDTDVAHLVDVKLLAMQTHTRTIVGHTITIYCVSMFVSWGIGCLLVVVGLTKWRQHLHLGLIAKLLRAQLESERGASPPGAAGKTET